MRGYLKILAVVISFIVISQIVSSLMPKITVNETDLVKIDAKTFDPDNDEIIIEYSKPLNSSGEWQTTYGDYGEYIINISASDGKLKSIQRFKLIVRKVNWPPEIEDLDDIIVDEGDVITITPIVKDPENDKINVYISMPIGNDGVWNTSYEDSGVYDITVTASDGEHSIRESFKLTVRNVNRIPKIDSYSPKETSLELREGSSTKFEISASDPDGDNLRYIWELDDEQISKRSSFTYEPDYNTSGDHKIVVFVSDRETTVKHFWNIKVIDTNRPPILDKISDIVIDENETIKIDIPAYDPDGDAIYYSISEPIGDDKIWKTTFDDAGEYIIDLKVSDGKADVDAQFKVIVNNVDRAPLFEKILDQEIEENQELRIKLNALDPDGDDITFLAENAPPGSELIDGEFIYTPTYDVIKKSGTIIDNIYQTLRLDRIFSSNKKTFDVAFTAKTDDKETRQTVKITVVDKNQPPYLKDLGDITIDELETVNVVPEAVEYDNDNVYFTISEPIGNDGVWKTGYEDSGIYNITVTASDGRASDVKTFTLTVEDVNRVPEIRLDEIKVNENETLKYKPSVSDADGDEVYLSVEEAPDGVELIDNELTWQPSFSMASKKRDHFYNKILSRFPFLSRIFSTNLEGYSVKLSASDNKDEAIKSTTVIVKDVNRAPVLINASPVSTFITHVGSPITFSVNASDPDEDDLTYTWQFNIHQKYRNITKIRRIFTTPGMKTVKVYIDDGYTAIVKKWRVKVLPKEVIKPSRIMLTETYVIGHDNVSEENSDSNVIQFEI